MALQETLEIDTSGYNIRGEKVHMSGQTLLQDAGRVIPLAYLTVMAQRASDQKWVPLDDIDQAMTNAVLTCGAIDGTMAEFAAVTDAELRLTVDGEVITLADMDMSGLDSVLDTSGYMTCGAIGGTLPEFQAVNDGEFGIAIDGQAAVNVGPVDFSGLDTETDTAGFYIGGANGAIVAAGYDAINDGSLVCNVDGVTITLTGLDWTAGVVSFFDVAAVVNNAFQGRATMLYNIATDVFRVISNSTGETSIVDTFTGAGGTDVSAVGYFNMAAAGAATPGTGGEGTAQTIPDLTNAALVAAGVPCFCYYNGDAFVFVSRTAGEISAVSDLTAGGGGTDISGAAFYNGLAGVNVAGTGGEGLGESIASIISAHAGGAFEVEFNGDAFVLISPNQGPVKSQITIMTDPSAGGTFIGGVGFMNGSTAVGTVTAATGANGTDQPAGLFWSTDVTAAALVAADVTSQHILVGKTVEIDEDTIVLENSLDLDDVVVSTGKTIRATLRGTGIFAKSAQYFQNYQPIA